MPTVSAVIKWATNIDELRRELKAGTGELVVLEKAAERTTRVLGGEGLVRSAHNTAAAIQNLGGVSSLTAKEQEKVHNQMGRVIEKMDALNVAAKAAGQQTQTIPEAFRQLHAETAKAAVSMGTFQSLMSKFDLGQIGRQAQQVGSMFTKVFTLPIIAALGGSTKAAMDFETSFANVAKTVDGVSDKSGVLTKEGHALAMTFRQMAKEIPATTDELNTIAALGGQMGVPIKQLGEFTRHVAALGVAVDGISTEEAAAGLAQIGNITGTGTKNIAQMASALVHLGNSSNATEGDILEFTKRLAGAGHSVGMTVPQIMALGTAMANVGINAEAGGTAMSTVITKISKAVSTGSKDLEEFARVANMSADGFAAVWKRSPVEALDAFIKGLSTMKARGVDLNLTMGELGTEGIRVADMLKRVSGAGDGVAKSLVVANEGFSAGNKHLEEAEKKYATTANQLKMLWSHVRDVGMTLGNAMLPAIKSSSGAMTSFMPVVDGVAKAFAAIPGPLQVMTIGVGLMVAAIGPMLWTFGSLLRSTKDISDAFAANSTATRALTSAYESVSKSATGAVSWITRIGGSARAAGLLMGGLSAALVGIAVPVALIVISERLKKIREDADALIRASELVGRPVSNAAEARALLAAQEAGAKGQTFKPQPFEPLTAEQATAWRDAKGPAEVYEGAVVKIGKAQLETNQQLRIGAGLTVEGAAAILNASGVASKYVGGVLQIGKAQQTAASSADLLRQAQLALAAADKKYNEELGNKRSAIQFDIQNMKVLGLEIEDIAKKYTVSKLTVERFKNELEGANKTFKSSALGEYRKKLAELVEGLTLAEKNHASAKDIAGQFGKQLADVTQEARVYGQVLPDVVKRNYDAVNQFNVAPILKKQWEELNEALAKQARVKFDSGLDEWFRVKQAELEMQRKSEAERRKVTGTTTTEVLADVKTEADNLRAQFDERKTGHKAVLDQIDIWEKRAAAAAINEWAKIAERSKERLGDWSKGLIGEGFINVLKTIPTMMQAALTGGGGVKGGLQAIGSKLGAELFGGLFKEGNAINDFLATTIGKGIAAITRQSVTSISQGLVKSIPMIGETIGALLVPIMGKLLKTESKQVNDLRDKFLAQFGAAGTGEGSGFANLAKQLHALGPAGDVLFQRVLNATKVKDFEAAVNDANAALGAQKQKFDAFNASLQTGLQRIKELGGGVPDALKPLLDGLREAGKLSADNIALLSELASGGTVNWEALEQAASRYGASTDKLGKAFNAAKLHDAWQQIIDDIDLFERGGVDVNGMLVDMADEISKLAQDSQKFGAEIPENMRPWMQKLIDAGLLLDSAGDKITDIGKLTFGETLQTSLQKLTAEIRQLILALGGVPTAIDAIPPEVNVDVNLKYRPGKLLSPDEEQAWYENQPTPDVSGYARRGGFVTQYGINYLKLGGSPWRPMGTDTVPAMLTPGEGVLSLRGMETLGALNDGINPWSQQANLPTAGAPMQAVVVLEVDSRQFARANVPVFPNETRRLGVRVRT